MYSRIDWLERLTVQFSCSLLSDSCDPMNCSTLGLPVQHQLLELAQTHSIESVMPSKSYFIYVYTHTHTYINNLWALPWWYSGFESSCCYRGHGFNPWSRKIPWSMPQFLRATKPMLHNY